MASKNSPDVAGAKGSNRTQEKTSSVASANVQASAEPAESMISFFKLEDWLAGLVTALFSGLVFFHFMAPEVTLEDSGELVTGAFTFGVPHPPGYPLWAFLGFLWCHFVVPFGNPAWRICTMSVVTGALTVGVLTLTMTRSIRMLLHSLPWCDSMGEDLRRWMALTLGVSSALLFGFNRGVWLWACVSEMRVLNVFSFVLISCVFFIWTVQPQRRGFLYATLLLFGASLANHQTIAVMALPLGVGTLAVGLEQFVDVQRKTRVKGRTLDNLMTCLANFWELSSAGLLCGMVALIVLAWLEETPALQQTMFQNMKFFMGLVAGATGVILVIVGRITRWWQPRRALFCAALFLAGVSFYLYMPLSASTNPPMNWGYAATKEGFLHAITRGQYEQVKLANVFSEEFRLKIEVFFMALAHQYSIWLCLLGIITLIIMGFWWLDIRPRGRAWMVFVWAAFLVASFGLLTIINPKLDRQEQEINIKFFAPAHGFYAMLIGYGIAVLISILGWRPPKGWGLLIWGAILTALVFPLLQLLSLFLSVKFDINILSHWHNVLLIGMGLATALTFLVSQIPKVSGAVLRISCVALLALPIVTYERNWDLCNLRGHDFGYLFGYLMFNPGGGYQPMDKDAVLYGGTDPGRFVPTYMIFCESRVPPKDRFRNKDFDRSDVYIITQNALADTTYMCYIRDHYDFTRPKDDSFLQRLLGRDHTYPPDPIYIPSLEDNTEAFQQYVHDVNTGLIPPSADVKIENGRVTVQGAGGVMQINGILAKWIFDKNKDKHSFYVEESYVIPWMYPFLRPAGVIMKLEKDPLPPPEQNQALWADIVARDKAYWDKLTADFLARDEFRRSSDAKKSFSKMRSAIAGIYDFRNMIPQAEYAFKQSLQLCPESPEVNFRLATLYMRLHRYSEAEDLLAAYQKFDVYNKDVGGFLNNIKNVEKDDRRREEIEKSLSQKGAAVDINVGIELLGLYGRLNMPGQFEMLSRSIMSISNLPPNDYLAVAQLSGGMRKWEQASNALRRYLELTPRDYKAWIELAFVEMQISPDKAMAALKRAVAVGGDTARQSLEDERFSPLWQRPEFQALMRPPNLDSLALPLLQR